MSLISRRVTLAWVAAAASSPFLSAGAQTPPDAAQPGAWPTLNLTPLTAGGYGHDPDIAHPKVTWALTLTPVQRTQVKTIAGLMIPADSRSSSAATLPIDAFVDEWVSAPYQQQQHDRELILTGLAWLDAECRARFQADFNAVSDDQRRAVFDDIAWRAKVKPGHDRPAAFFARLRDLVMAGFYSLPEGYGDIGYVGNTPSADPYPGPPKEALAHLNAALARLGLKTV